MAGTLFDTLKGMKNPSLTPIIKQQFKMEKQSLISLLPSETTLLDVVRKNGPPDWQEEHILTFFLSIARGMKYLHEQNIILCNLRASHVYMGQRIEGGEVMYLLRSHCHYVSIPNVYIYILEL